MRYIKIIFLVFLFIILLEIGFYLGLNYQKDFIPQNSERQEKRQEIVFLPEISLKPTVTPILRVSPPPKEYKSASGSVVISSQAIDNRMLDIITERLKSADKGMVTQANISYTLRGRIVALDKNARLIWRDGKEYENILFLSLENLTTKAVTDAYLEPNFTMPYIYLTNLDKKNGAKKITIDDLKVGDIVEIENSYDLLNSRFILRKLTLIEKSFPANN